MPDLPTHSWYSVSARPRSLQPPLAGDLSCDVCVVGAGYTGLWAAYYLQQAAPGTRIVILDANVAGFGASGRNGGWCSALLPMGLDAIARSLVLFERRLFSGPVQGQLAVSQSRTPLLSSARLICPLADLQQHVMVVSSGVEQRQLRPVSSHRAGWKRHDQRGCGHANQRPEDDLPHQG